MITFSENQQKIVDALETVNNAHWIDNYNGIISCSNCHTWFYKDGRYSYMRYCPYCSCRMVEPQENKEISERNMKMWEEIFKAESEDKE